MQTKRWKYKEYERTERGKIAWWRSKGGGARNTEGGGEEMKEGGKERKRARRGVRFSVSPPPLSCGL